MIIKKSLPVTPINYFTDEHLLYVLLPNKSGVQFVTFDPETFESLSIFTINEKLNHNQAIIQEDRLFLITTDGIIGYDTFTGQQVVFMQTESLVPLSLGMLEDKLVSLCGIPILRNKKVNTDNFCICINDAKTGEKFFQSQTIHEPVQLTMSDSIWFALDGFIHKLSRECELISKRRLISHPDMPLIYTGKYIISASDMGTLEIFNKETLEQHANILVARNSSPPFVYDNSLFWITGITLRHINLSDNSVSKI